MVALTSWVSARKQRGRAQPATPLLYEELLGNDEGGEVNANLVTLLASCQMHGLEPLGYVRDLLCLLPRWSIRNVLELAPVNWTRTVEHEEVKRKLDENIFRQAALGILKPS